MKQEYPARMSEQQRAQLFELWKRAPFPEIASAVDGFMQGAVDRYTSGGGADGCDASPRYLQKVEARG